MQTDEELMSSYKKGDHTAFQALFERYAPIILRLMRRGMSNTQDAHDLVQKTFLQLHRARNDFRENSLVRPWLMTIALNLKREYLRQIKRSKEQGRKLRAHHDVQDDFEPHVQQVLLERNQTANQVRLALTKLPDAQRRVIELHWFEGLSFPEVAEIVEASVSAVKVRAHRGYKRLKETIRLMQI